MKKTTAMILSLLVTICLICAGCSNSGTNTDNAVQSTSSASGASQSTTGDKIVVGMTANNTAIDSYQTMHDKAFREKCVELGVEAICLDAVGDPNLQVNQIEDLIQKRVDVIVVWPVNGKAVVPACQKAKDAGIPVLIANTPIDESGYEVVNGYAGPDNTKQGVFAGELLIEGLRGKGKVVEITGLPGYVTTTERSNGIHQALDNAPDIEVLDSQPGNWSREKAQSVMENMITKYDQIDGVVCANDNMAIGAINAMKEAGRFDNVIVTSCNNFSEGYDAMKAGDIYGSEDQSPIVDAQLTAEIAVKLVKGESIEFFNYFDTPKVTIDNIDEFGRPSW